jgi:hypothetical protein
MEAEHDLPQPQSNRGVGVEIEGPSVFFYVFDNGEVPVDVELPNPGAGDYRLVLANDEAIFEFAPIGGAFTELQRTAFATAGLENGNIDMGAGSFDDIDSETVKWERLTIAPLLCK